MLRDNPATPKAEYGEELVMAKHLGRPIATAALLLVGATRIWAGVGDIDPNFGSGGRLGLLNEVSLVLPDDRLVIAYNAGNLIVARLDANGKVDPSFGEGGPTFADGGETRVPLPGAWQRFYAYYASATPDGGLVFAGPLRDFDRDVFVEAVLRLDSDGHLVKSFGGRGDGYFRLTDAPINSFGLLPTSLMAMAVDANGRVLLAARSWTADGRCNGPTRVVRLTASGSIDATFGTNGRASVPGVDLCDGVALFGVRSDGSIVVGDRHAMVGLDPGGALAADFGEGGQLSFQGGVDWKRGRLLPDGSTLVVGHSWFTTDEDDPYLYPINSTVLMKFDRHGRPDTAFGAGGAWPGSVWLNLASAFFGGTLTYYQLVDDFVLAPDAAHIYLKLAVRNAHGALCAGGIARISLDGTPDTSFGRQGLTCLDYGAFWFQLLGSQRNGAALFRHGEWTGGVYRLLTDATPSPGMLTMVRNFRIDAGEADGVVTVPVMRTAGRDGALSVDFSTGPRYPDDGDGSWGYDATPGSDFHAASGRLDWVDGGDGQREITVTILDDVFDEPDERFSIGISNPQGGALAPGTDAFPDYERDVEVAIVDDDGAAPPTNPPATNPPATNPPATNPPSTNPPPTSLRERDSGGGGAVSWLTVLMASALLLARQRRVVTSRRRPRSPGTATSRRPCPD